ncbi:hypothetical protein SAMN05421833_12376 [Microbispora rosea]|uniref:Uncharacterized protein n=1 Tax=Microbispora rosea TaxID=58117 RepID=A0A1N7FQ71_9ACTN|nr:hypothetical protein [Microbispora rosea]GIH50784.1 hypothetical protein Mro03_59630 [Microbispora rosea subsp. rosea]SIS02414.1 hypothetical protein SAMN05421833_12376 [Microbispora rosea]
MAIPRKGSRLITVDGVAYRWRIRRKPTYGQAIGEGSLSFAIELAEGPGLVLLVSLPFSLPDVWVGERTMAVRPALVAEAVRMALGQGWDPRQAGRAFDLDVTEDDLVAMLGGPPVYEVPFARR